MSLVHKNNKEKKKKQATLVSEKDYFSDTNKENSPT